MKKRISGLQKRQTQLEPGVLYLVGTPIGNVSDFSPRAAEILAGADLIACEDTRNSSLLLSAFGIKKPLISYHDKNYASRIPRLIAELKAGKIIALISDAGMPVISDPGEKLVFAAHENGIKVSVIPGPSAFTAALAVSGMSAESFIFEGFLPAKSSARKKKLAELLSESRTLIFYEAPHRLLDFLKDMESEGFSERKLCIARELTKEYEEVKFFQCNEAVKYYRENGAKGEFVIVAEAASKFENNEENGSLGVEKIKLRDDMAIALAAGRTLQGKSITEASAEAALLSNLSKNEIYKALISLKNRKAETSADSDGEK